MPTAEDAATYAELGQTLYDYATMTDSGDRQTFTAVPNRFSGKSGFAPTVRPDGVVSGNKMVSAAASASNDVVDIAAFTAYSGGSLKSVAAATDQAVTRPATDVAKVSSITMTSAGAIAEIEGTDGSDTTFSETRGAAGGPPLIPAGSVEIAQVRMTSATSAAITDDEIYQVSGQHCERYDYPGFSISPLGLGRKAKKSAETYAHVKFDAVLPAIHTGGAAKGVAIKCYEPVLVKLSKTLDFSPAKNSHSISTTQYYGGSASSRSSSLGQASFTALVNDGISDSLMAEEDEIITIQHFPDENKDPYTLTQGACAVDPSYPATGQIQVAVTITPESASPGFIS